MRKEPFGFRIWTDPLGNEKEVTACEDCAELLDRFSLRFP